jgi:glycolate oxidase iron-sulfur subunit
VQTAFSEAALQDPAMRASEKILRTCVHCGFCTATCPTYLLLGDELDSPRGRIYLIKEMLESGAAPTPEVVTHIDRCLSCLSCMTTCPSGVHYMHLVDHARAHIEKTYDRPWHERLMRAIVAGVLPHPSRFRAALALALLARPFAGLIGRLPRIGPTMRAMLDLAPSSLPPRGAEAGERLPAPAGPRARVALLTGCAQSALDPGINAAAIRLLNRHGVEVVLPAGEGCCGALVHHLGREEESHAFARRNIDAWTAEIEGAGLDAIVITASGCGTSIKDYGYVFRNDPAYAAKAARVSALAKDVTEYLETVDLAFGVAPRLTVAYHSACSMQHGQQIKDGPKRLLQRAGFTVRDVPEGHICCGSAGSYNLLQPEIAGKLRARKAANILKARPDVVATGNLGCITHIGKGFADGGGARPPIVHTVELLDWATGGEKPSALR